MSFLCKKVIIKVLKIYDDKKENKYVAFRRKAFWFIDKEVNMELFVPNILTVQQVSQVSADKHSIYNVSNIVPPADSLFKKVYFEELTKNCFKDNGNFDELQSIARIHYEEYFGVGSTKVKRWRVYYTQYNILVNIEEDEQGKIFVKAA